jgi:uncharacterized protein
MSHERQLPPAVFEAVAAMKAALEDSFGSRLREVRVFGSVARGEAREDSDVDVLVVLDRIERHADRRLVHETAHDAGFARDLPLQALVLDERELELLRQRETGLARDLDREGVRL